MTQNRYYSSNAVKTTLTSGINNSATSIPVAATTGFPGTTPFTLIIDRDTGTEEVVTVTGVSGLTLTVTRGVDGTGAVSHSNGATVEHGVSARDFNEPQAHIGGTTGVHGLTGAPVGTTDAQTLTNKTLTQPTIGDFTNAGHTHANAAGGGALNQANTHGSPDTDTATTSLHHTIGTSGTQAAAGNHNHSGTYSAVGHTHVESDVTSLVSDLGNKSNVGHTHTLSNITDIANVAPAWANVTGKPLSTIAGGTKTLTFTSGTVSFAHGMGTTPLSVQITTLTGGPVDWQVMLDGPVSWDATNIYVRAAHLNTGTNFSGSATFAWLAFA